MMKFEFLNKDIKEGKEEYSNITMSWDGEHVDIHEMIDRFQQFLKAMGFADITANRVCYLEDYELAKRKLAGEDDPSAQFVNTGIVRHMSMKSHYCIVVWEGTELVGKSTLKKEFEIATNFRHLCVDRMFITSLVYNAFKGRHADLEEEILNDLEFFIGEFDPLFVIVETSEEVKMKRFEKRGEWYITPEEFSSLAETFREVVNKLLKQYPRNFLVIRNDEDDDIITNVEIVKSAVEAKITGRK